MRVLNVEMTWFEHIVVKNLNKDEQALVHLDYYKCRWKFKCANLFII
jgi:hypothetical protein